MSQEVEGAQVNEKQDEIDAILDAALDELDEEQQMSTSPSGEPVSSKQTVRNSEEQITEEQHIEVINKMMQQMLDGNRTGGDDGGDFGAIVQEMQKHIQTEMEAGHRESGSDVDRAINKLMEDMACMGNTDPEGGQQIMEEMMKEFEKMGGNLNADDMIDGMMGQLLAKDLMYEPMKQVSERFPEWLKENKSRISEEDYTNRCKQYECFQRLIHLYETKPNDVESLMMLMQEVQEYGQPPPEIVKEIAPGLELDEDGIPKMDLLNGNEECRIM